MDPLVARDNEQKLLQSFLQQDRAQLIALTGRRRIGKTFLVRKSISQGSIFLEIVGSKKSSPIDLKDNFLSSIEETLGSIAQLSRNLKWRVIFKTISTATKKTPKEFIIFLDELPWMVAADPEFLPALEHIWNSEWSQLKNLKLIICGSATSWMKEEIFNNTGGFFSRLTGRIELNPFSIQQCKELAVARKLKLNLQQLLEYYLVLGGVPYYWSLIEPMEPAAEFVQRLFFVRGALLKKEFSAMMEAIFRDSDAYLKILKALGRSRYGMSRDELAKLSKVSSGGTLERALKELCDCLFVNSYVPFGYQERGMYFRLYDEFLLFHLTWLERLESSGIRSFKDYWLKQQGSGQYNNWIGNSFEIFCQKHADDILNVLGISGIRSEVSTWRTVDKKATDKIQIDLVIDRADGVVTLVECKYSNKPIILPKRELENCLKRQSLFVEQTKTKKFINSILVCSNTFSKNLAAKDVFYRIINIEDLFKFNAS
jgi:AAA+ ATPase superfamily predicted ATPase